MGSEFPRPLNPDELESLHRVYPNADRPGVRALMTGPGTVVLVNAGSHERALYERYSRESYEPKPFRPEIRGLYA